MRDLQPSPVRAASASSLPYQPARLPDNEPERLAELENYKILDTLPERSFDDLSQITAQICDTPMAVVSLVDRDRQWFKSTEGLEASETPAIWRSAPTQSSNRARFFWCRTRTKTRALRTIPW